MEENSPAGNAGFQPGDIILKINHVPVHAEYEENLPHIRKLIADYPIGKPMPIEILRNGKTKVLVVKTIPEPIQEQPEFEAPKWGLVIKNISWNLYRFQNLPDFNGVVVESIRPGSLADAAGIQEGDVIRFLNHTVVTNRKTFINLYNQWLEGVRKAVFLEIIRSGHPYYAVIKPSSL